MRYFFSRTYFASFILGIVLFAFFPQPASASHSWSNYHWAITSNPFTLKLGDNLSSVWDPYLQTTSTDWSVSVALDTTVVPGQTSSRRCRPSSGRVEVCNYKYGKNGWLGLAQIWINTDHITKAVTKLNDSYFNTNKYNTPAWRNLVLCQEVGHTFGLDHQDEGFDNPNLGTCMDYTANPSGFPDNEHPNQHDFDMLNEIYTHLDGITTLQSSRQRLPLNTLVPEFVQNMNFENMSEWGKQIRNNRKVALFVREFGQGDKLFTFVIWAE